MNVAGLSLALPRANQIRIKPSPPLIAAAIAFLILFWSPIVTLGRDWWSDPDAGHGLDGIIRGRKQLFTGILNGIDTHEWDPATDVYLPAAYSADDLTGKADVKREGEDVSIITQCAAKLAVQEEPSEVWPLEAGTLSKNSHVVTGVELMRLGYGESAD